jgi:hypothetical protein
MNVAWGFDLLILAGVLGVGSSYITVKSNLEPLSPQLAGTFFGQNTYQLRNLISMRNDAIAGTIWLGFSLVAMSAGTIITSIDSPNVSLKAALVHTLLMMGLGFVSVWITLSITSKLSRRTYIPQMLESQCDLFNRCIKYLAMPDKADELSRDLDQIGILINLRRFPNETNTAFIERLQPYFLNIRPGAEN